MPTPSPSNPTPLQPRGRPVIRAAVAATALALLASACGDDDATTQEPAADQQPSGGSESGGSESGGSEAGAGDAVGVIAEDIGFGEDEYRAEAGEVSFVYENQGNIAHTLLIDGVDDFELEVSSTGDVDEGSVELDAGEYRLYCDIPGHEVAGMEAPLVVE